MKLIQCQLFAITMLFYCSTLVAQDDLDLTQRWFNESIYNPGAIGNSFSTGVFLHGRIQWLGLEGAPSTQGASFDTYVEKIRSGFGLTFLRDQLGYVNSYSAKLGYAYNVLAGAKSIITFGLSAGLLNRNKNIEQGMAAQEGDPFLRYSKNNYYSPDFDLGVEYKGPFKAGLSIRHIGTSSKLNQSVNFWGYINTRFNVVSAVSMEPCLSVMARDGIGRYEAGSIFYFFKTSTTNVFNDKYWLGGMYRFHGQFALLLGLTLGQEIRLGYSFDYGLGNLGGISKSGTHEIFLGWQLNRIFYKEPLCPAYRGSREYLDYDKRRKKHLSNFSSYR